MVQGFLSFLLCSISCAESSPGFAISAECLELPVILASCSQAPCRVSGSEQFEFRIWSTPGCFLVQEFSTVSRHRAAEENGRLALGHLPQHDAWLPSA